MSTIALQIRVLREHAARRGRTIGLQNNGNCGM
jgi:hypothetical protein